MSLYVLTGGPSSGKTTIIRELAAMGKKTMPEAAQMEIDRAIGRGKDPDDVIGTTDLQTRIVNRNKIMERIALRNDDKDFYLDRSLADNIVYMRDLGMEIPDQLINECQGRYEEVFVLDPVGFEDDYSRKEDGIEEAYEIRDRLVDVYQELGYDPYIIEQGPVLERRAKILQHTAPSLSAEYHSGLRPPIH